MGILGALFAGVSGLDVYSSSIEVIGNNIANTNTSGFKGSRAEFSDILSASLSGTVSGNQIGRGVQLASVSTQFSQGSFESTASGTDLAIDGKGFFIVNNSDGTFYSRAGQFNINNAGLLVNSRGDRVQGFALDVTGNPSGAVGDLDLTVTNAPPKKTSDVSFVANLDASEPPLGTAGKLTSGGQVTDRFQFLTGVNDVIKFNDGGSRTASITTNTTGASNIVSGAQYSAAEVAAGLKQALEAQNGGADTYTVSYSASTKKFSITNDSTNTNAITLEHTDATSTLSDDLGFSTAANDAVALGSTATSDNQVQFNVVAGRNLFNYTIDGGFYSGKETPGTAGATQATVAVGSYTADGLSKAIEASINTGDDADAVDRIRAVRVTHNAGTNTNKFQVTSQTTGAARVIDIASDSNSIEIPASSIRVKESLLGVLGLTNLNPTDSFSFTTGFNDVINFDFDHTAGVNPADVSLIGGVAGQLTTGTVVTSKEVEVAIKTTLETADATAATYTVAFDATAKKFNIKKDSGANFTINWAAGTTTAESELGFTANDVNQASGGGGVTSDTALTTAISNRSGTILDGTGTFDVKEPSKLTSSSFSTPLTVFDSLGTPHSISVYFRKIGENIWEYNGTMQGVDITGPATDTANEQLIYGRLWFTDTGALDLEDKFVGPLNVDGTANAVDGNGFRFPRANRFNFEGGATANQQISFDFGTAISSDAATSGGLDGVTQFAGSSAVINQVQNGYTTGTLQGIGIGRNGNVTGQFTNGQTRDLARIILANFSAPQALASQGSNLWAETLGSGQANLGKATTAGFGAVLSNSIELSNVDIAEEFVKLIQEQQAFQANARVISTTEDLLDEVVNLTR